MNSAAVFAFTCPVKINSGMKALEHLPVELAGLNAVNPLVVANARAVGPKAVRTLTDAFGDSGMTLGLFEGVTEAADLGVVNHLKSICLERKYDAFIALGGGKAADFAKVLNLAVSLKTPDARQLSPEAPVRKRLLPLVVVRKNGKEIDRKTLTFEDGKEIATDDLKLYYNYKMFKLENFMEKKVLKSSLDKSDQ